ncbi:hypothetical protein AnigIFM60653_009914 [Aspergillus niger]|nr:hypothetical protein AnigIFM50267_011792 [Aspergillus niger]GLA08383.1 hypothetical protein AnigIFM60653_009914 [Aspergillus niger]
MAEPRSSEPTKKRRRPALACAECRRRKVKCDRDNPCGQCTAHGQATCTYIGQDHALPGPSVQQAQPLQQPVVRNSAGQNPDASNWPFRGPPPRVPTVDVISNTENSVRGVDGRCPSPVRVSSSDHRRQDTQRSSPSSVLTTPSQVHSGVIHGTLAKTRLFGPGHWMSAFPLVEGLPNLNELPAARDTSHREASEQVTIDRISQAVNQCKEKARAIKQRLPSRRPLPADVYQSFPPRLVVDELVQTYFDSFEWCYKVLHAGSFRSEYTKCMDALGTADSSSVAKLLLVMSVAAPLYGSTQLCPDLLSSARTWIHVCQSWLSAPVEKDRLTVDGLQIYCLLLLARQIHRVGADLVWISVGSLLRMAMQMGLHQDPDHLGGMSNLQKEIRRRLWYTILELNMQTALDSGVPPTITVEDYTTKMPSNVNDDVLEVPLQDGGLQDEDCGLTTTTFQRLLAASLKVRVEALQTLNRLQGDPAPYETVLSIGSNLSSACRRLGTFVDKHVAKLGAHPPSHFSLRICLETTLGLISLLESDLYHRLLLVGGGMFRDLITRGALVLFTELNITLERGGSTLVTKWHRSRIDQLLEDARKLVQYAKDRLHYGETNVKGYLYISMAMGQVEAMLRGTSVEDAIANAAIDCLTTCQKILETLAIDSFPSNPPESSFGCYNAMYPLPTAVEADFEFLDSDDVFGIADSSFLQQWADQPWV